MLVVDDQLCILINSIILHHTSTALPAIFRPVSGSKGGPAGGASRPKSVWPRVDPAVIMLTTAGEEDEWCLLGRKPDWWGVGGCGDWG